MAENGRQTKDLTPAQRRAVAALLTERTARAAAEKAKIAERTLYRWLADPDFSRALSEAEGEVIAGATRRLLQLQDKAIDAVDDVFKDGETSAAVKLRAAQLAIDAMLKLRELRNVESRLAALEAAAAAPTSQAPEFDLSRLTDAELRSLVNNLRVIDEADHHEEP